MTACALLGIDDESCRRGAAAAREMRAGWIDVDVDRRQPRAVDRRAKVVARRRGGRGGRFDVAFNSTRAAAHRDENEDTRHPGSGSHAVPANVTVPSAATSQARM